jgi:hypothetical protein
MEMMNITRTPRVFSTTVATLVLAGCGSAAPAASSVSGTTAPLSSPSPTPGVCANPDVSPTTDAVTSLSLTVDQLPPTSVVLTQISDGKMNNTPNTDQRGFANITNTYRIEDDVVIDASTQTATTDYPQLRAAAQSQVTTVAGSSSPVGLGCQADEYIGTTSTGYSEIGISFQEGDIISVLLIVDSTGKVDAPYALAVAQAQDQKIVAAAN